MPLNSKLCFLKEESVSMKIRVVFNTSVTPQVGESLNQCLLTGPNLQKDLTRILMLFQCHCFVFTADIRQMYRQIEVHSAYREYQRILWRFDFQDPVQEFQLRTVAYGLSSSPFLAIPVLQQMAADETDKRLE